MPNAITKDFTPEQAAELVSRIVPAGNDDAARALTALVAALASVSDEGTREAIAVAVAEHAYNRTDEYGNALLAFLNANSAGLSCAEHSH